MKNKQKLKSASFHHPWRICADGMYFRNGTYVSEYVRSDGIVVSAHYRSSTCALNPSGKDSMHMDEISAISKKYFNEKQLKKNMPCQLTNATRFENNFDLELAGWTQYWNEVLSPSVKLSSNLVKALIFTESTFNESTGINNKKSAAGLTQLLSSTVRILGDEKGELSDHFLIVSREQLFNGNISICAGIRWLFYKKKLLTKKNKQESSWEDAVVAYKGLDLKIKRHREIYHRFLNKYLEYQKCKK